MKIERAYTILTCPGRNFVTLKIVTNEGVHGLGDATLNGRELAVKAYLDEHVVPCLLGRDPPISISSTPAGAADRLPTPA